MSARTADLFPATVPARQKPSVLGHVIDAGDNGLPGGVIWARLKCRRDHEFEVTGKYSITELKRGQPCPICNAGAIDDYAAVGTRVETDKEQT